MNPNETPFASGTSQPDLRCHLFVGNQLVASAIAGNTSDPDVVEFGTLNVPSTERNNLKATYGGDEYFGWDFPDENEDGDEYEEEYSLITHVRLNVATGQAALVFG